MAAGQDNRSGDKGNGLGNALELAAANVLKWLRATFPDVGQATIEECVAEAVRQFLQKGEGCASERLLPILRRQAMWNLYHMLRATRRRAQTPPGGIEQVSEDAKTVEQRVLEAQARTAMTDERLLSRRSRLIIHLWSLGYRAREIAIRLHLKTATVRKKKERALRRLRERLGLGKHK